MTPAQMLTVVTVLAVLLSPVAILVALLMVVEAAARAEVRRNALIPPRAPIVRPALATFAAALHKRYVRWSSATSTGSKPTTARA